MEEQIIDQYMRTLNTVFGYREFNDYQKEALTYIARKIDLLSVFQTGTGKSLLYQIPALSEKTGITIVVSPLLATMNDQIDALAKFAPGTAAVWNSEQSTKQKKHLIQMLISDNLRLLYCSPEALDNALSNLISHYRITVNRIAVDESHLIDTWGHNFRPSFMAIGENIKSLCINKQIPIIALTATADENTRKTIERILKRKLKKIVQCPVKSHIDYQVIDIQKHPNKLQSSSLSQFLQAQSEARRPSGHINNITTNIVKLVHSHRKVLVFSASRKKCEFLNQHLMNTLPHFAHFKYHGGLSSQHRKQAQSDFKNLKSKGILIATNSFGVGVDIPDIDLVIHVDIPLNVDSYLQESGRAGRNGKPTQAVILYDGDETLKTTQFLLRKSNPSPESLIALINKINSIRNENMGRGFSLMLNNREICAMNYMLTNKILDGELVGNKAEIYDVLKFLDVVGYKQNRESIFKRFEAMNEYLNPIHQNKKSYLINYYNTDSNATSGSTQQVKIDSNKIQKINEVLDNFAFTELHCNPNVLMNSNRRKALFSELKKQGTIKKSMINTNHRLNAVQAEFLIKEILKAITLNN